jgi:hypothetical protein
MQTTSRRPARYSEEFGKGILPEHDAFPFGVIASSHGPGVPPSVIMDHIFAKEKAEAEAKRLALPPLSGGSDAATAEVEVHHGDDYCPECGEFHEPQARYGQAVPSPIARRPGPDAIDMAFEHGRSAALECRHHRILPPVGLGSAEVTAFFAGVDSGRDEYHAEAMAEIDGAMAAAY